MEKGGGADEKLCVQSVIRLLVERGNDAVLLSHRDFITRLKTVGVSLKSMLLRVIQ